MPADALASLRVLRHQLGREPTLEELYRLIGVEPSGTPSTERPFPGREPDESGDGRLTAELQLRELMDTNPEIRRIREQLIAQLLFGGAGGGIPPFAMGQPGPGHGPRAMAVSPLLQGPFGLR